MMVSGYFNKGCVNTLSKLNEFSLFVFLIASNCRKYAVSEHLDPFKDLNLVA